MPREKIIISAQPKKRKMAQAGRGKVTVELVIIFIELPCRNNQFQKGSFLPQSQSACNQLTYKWIKQNIRKRDSHSLFHSAEPFFFPCEIYAIWLGISCAGQYREGGKEMDHPSSTKQHIMVTQSYNSPRFSCD